MAFAPTRSGKGVGLVVPTLLSWTGNAIIHDIKGENWSLTSKWRSEFSRCIRFDPTDLASSRFNPLLEIRLGAQEVRDAQNVADILVDPEGSLERRNHWDKTAHSLLVGAILHVLYAEDDKSLAGVATLLSDPARPIDETLERMLDANHLGSRDRPLTHPAVAEAAVIGVPHPKWQERPLLLVVPRPGMRPSREEILDHLAERVAKWWLPNDVVFVEDLPHTATGKLLKVELRNRYREHRLPDVTS